MVVREVFARLGLNVNQGSFRRGDQALAGIKRAAAAIGVTLGSAAVVRGFQRLIDRTVDLGDRMDKLSGRTGIAASTLQEFRHAAALTGVDARTADDGLQRMTRRLTQAAQGHGAAKRAVEQYGITLRDSNGEMLSAEELLGEVTDAMARAGNEADGLALAYDVFGRSGEDLALTLSGGREQLEAMMQEARDLGGVMSDELVRDSAALRDEQQRLSMMWQGMANMLAEEVVPYLVESARGMQAWFRANRELIRQNMEHVGRGIVHAFSGVKNILWGVWQTGSALVRAVDSLTRGLGDLGRIGGRVALIFAGIALLFGIKKAVIFAFALLVALVVEDMIVWLRGGESAIDKMIRAIVEADIDPEKNPIRYVFQQWLKELTAAGGMLDSFLEDLQDEDIPFLSAMLRHFTRIAEVVTRIVDGVAMFSPRLAKAYGYTPGVAGARALVARRDRAEGRTRHEMGPGDPLLDWRARGGMMSDVRQPGGGVVINQTIDLDVHGGPEGEDFFGKLDRVVNDANDRLVREAHRELVPEAP